MPRKNMVTVSLKMDYTIIEQIGKFNATEVFVVLKPARLGTGVIVESL